MGGTLPPFEMMAAALRQGRTIWTGEPDAPPVGSPAEVAAKVKDSSEVMYFAGCTAGYVDPGISEAALRVLDAAGIEYCSMGADEPCCGAPMKVAGKWDLFEEIYERNIAEARRRGVNTIVTACPSCALTWKEHYAEIARSRGDKYEFRVAHFAEIAAENLGESLVFRHRVDARVAFHDGCRMGRGLGIYDAPRRLLAAVPGVEVVSMEHEREEGLCCGSLLPVPDGAGGGRLSAAQTFGEVRVREALAAGAGALVTACPVCEVRLRAAAASGEIEMPIRDLGRILAEGLGSRIPECGTPTGGTWTYFAALAGAMETEALAHVVEAAFPQLVGSLSRRAIRALRAVRAAPGGRALLETGMPVVLPRWLRRSMTRLAPTYAMEITRRVGPAPGGLGEAVSETLASTIEALAPRVAKDVAAVVCTSLVAYMMDEM